MSLPRDGRETVVSWRKCKRKVDGVVGLEEEVTLSWRLVGRGCRLPGFPRRIRSRHIIDRFGDRSCAKMLSNIVCQSRIGAIPPRPNFDIRDILPGFWRELRRFLQGTRVTSGYSGIEQFGHLHLSSLDSCETLRLVAWNIQYSLYLSRTRILFAVCVEK